MRARQRRRPPWRSLADGIVFLALLTLLALGASRAGWFAPETGHFTAIDGDSLRKGQQEYRLQGIDAPELRQSCTAQDGKDYPCGRRAHDQLRSLVQGRALTCTVRETDRYGRLIASCSAQGADINRAMVRSGWAVAYGRHGGTYGDAEAGARRERLGLWQGSFETPQRWRDRRRSGLVRGGVWEAPLPED